MEKILIIENDDASTKFYADLLQEAGCEVVCTSSGQQGLDKITEHNFSVVITDLVTTDISGLEVLSGVMKYDPTINVIMVTGNTSIESAISALKLGAKDYLVTPVNPDEFRHSVTQSLEQRRLSNENEELKSMINLFQASQSIAGCLELKQIHHLLVKTIADVIGVSRAMGIFQEEN